MTAAEFIAQATEHYKAKLAEEKERFGVLGISAVITDNTRILVGDGAGKMWADLSEQSGLWLCVDCAMNSSAVFVILSKERVPFPKQLYELWNVIDMLANFPDDSSLDLLEYYEGPYKLEIPKLEE